MDSPHYSLGFLFKKFRVTDKFTDVCLITKGKPDWMKGRLNGVGGKLEPGEMPLQCMIREFEEETGARVTNWQPVAILDSDHKTTMFVYKGWCYPDTVIQTMTKEPVRWYSLDPSHVGYYGNFQTVPNLHWLIPMCLFDPDYIHSIADTKR